MLVDSFLFKHDGGGEVSSRGAAAATELAQGFACLIPEASLLSVATVLRSLLVPKESGSGQAQGLLERRRTDGAGTERGLLALFLIRERARERSELAPYIHAFLGVPPEIPAGWDPRSDEGSSKRAALNASRPELLIKADAVRRSVGRIYAQLVPAAIETMAASLSEGLPCSFQTAHASPTASSSCTREQLASIYSPQLFAEVMVAIASRDFVNSRQRSSAEPLGTDGVSPFPATFLVPLIDLMNHGGAESTMRVAYSLKDRGFVMRAERRIAKGEQLTFRYSSQMCREEAFSTYGFSDPGLPPCPADVTTPPLGQAY